MTWLANRPGCGQARLLALEAIIQEAVLDLNEAMQACPETSYLITKTGLGPLDPKRCVGIGDLNTMPGIENGWGQLRVCSAGHREGMDFLSKIAYLSPSGGYEDTFYTGIYGYLHNDAFRREQKILLERTREIANEIVSDWLRARVLNYVGPLRDGTHADRRIIYLQSRERVGLNQIDRNTGQPATDYLSDCLAVQGNKGDFIRQYSGERFYGVQFHHYGLIRG